MLCRRLSVSAQQPGALLTKLSDTTYGYIPQMTLLSTIDSNDHLDLKAICT